MDLTRDSGQVLRLFAFYQAIVAGVCLAGLGVRPVLFLALALTHTVAAGLLLRAAAAPRTDSGGRRRLVLPYALWLIGWLELGWLIRLSGLPMHDAQVVAADLALFGGHGHVLFPQWAPALDSAMQLIYLSYYGIILGPPLILALRGQICACDRYTLVVMATYLLCFVAYLLNPVLGPRAAAAAAHLESSHGGGFPTLLAEALRQAGDSPGTAFPSSHCAGAGAAALAAGDLVSRRIRFLLLLWAGLIAVSTVHTGNHYGIDAAAGIAVALGVRLVVVRVRHIRSATTEEAWS